LELLNLENEETSVIRDLLAERHSVVSQTSFIEMQMFQKKYHLLLCVRGRFCNIAVF